MNVGILIVAIVDMLVGFLLLAVFRPLVEGKIARNGFYGLRTRETLASDKAWYAVNRGAGKAAMHMSTVLIIFSFVVAILSIALVLLPSRVREDIEVALLIAALTAPLVLVLGLMVATNIELKKLEKAGKAVQDDMF